MLNPALFSSNSAEWTTPTDFFKQLDREFHFTLDPCATPSNAKCAKFYTIETDGLAHSWRGERVFCNPPYGREIARWVRKAHEEVTNGGADLVVMLIPARTDTAYFHDYIYHHHEIRFLRGRLHFNDGPTGAPFPSMIVVMRPDDGSPLSGPLASELTQSDSNQTKSNQIIFSQI